MNSSIVSATCACELCSQERFFSSRSMSLDAQLQVKAKLAVQSDQ